MGVLKPDSGRVLLDGEDITGLPMYRRAILGLGYLPQETSIFRGLTIEKNILTVLELAEPDKAARQQRLDKLLDEFGLTRLRDAPAMALSGGERRSEEHTSELQSLMRISYAVFCLKKQKEHTHKSIATTCETAATH